MSSTEESAYGKPEGTSAEIMANARRATEKEHQMTLWEGIKLYPKAVAWSMVISTCIVMEGYDVCLLGQFYALPQFNEKYGRLNKEGKYEVSAPWQAGLSNGAAVGQIIGLGINGYVSERFGYRYTVMACLTMLAGFIALFFCAHNIIYLQVAEILCGIPWGVFQTLTITYASEVCPVALRGYLTCYVNFCWGIGQVIGVGTVAGMSSRNDEWAYRVPYALQWMWPVPLFIGVLFAPESPWWLVRKGRYDDARRSLLRLTSRKDANFNVDETVDMMKHTNNLENEITSGSSYLDCFKGTDLRRTEIVCMVWAIQNLSGNSFSGYSTYFLEKAGVAHTNAYKFTLGQYSINAAAVAIAWALMARGVGRRTLYLYGLVGLFVALIVMGALGAVPEAHRKAASLATGSMMLVWALAYQITVGTVCYAIVAEVSTRRLQIKTVVLGRLLYNVVGIICNILTPYMLNTDAWNWSNYAAFFWAGTCFCSLVYTYFRVPECTGRSFGEIDWLFEQGVPARKFASTHVDLFDDIDKHETQHNEKAALDGSQPEGRAPAATAVF